MAFDITTKIENGVAQLTLTGRLDASVAQLFRENVEKAANDKAAKLVLFLEELEYMASAGLRVLVFARQKMGREVDIILVAPQDIVRETIEVSGFHQAVKMVDTYDA